MGKRLKVQVWIHSGSSRETRVLLLKTRPDRGAFWQPVTGSVEKGETLAAAARREAGEETGLSFSGPLEPLDYSFSYEKGDHQFEEHAFALRADAIGPESDGPVRLDPREHTEYRWLLPDEALAMTRFPSNQKGLRLLLARFSSPGVRP